MLKYQTVLFSVSVYVYAIDIDEEHALCALPVKKVNTQLRILKTH